MERIRYDANARDAPHPFQRRDVPSLGIPGLTALLSISIVVLVVAIGASVVLLSRSGETRVGLLTLLFAFLASSQAITLGLAWGTPGGALSVVASDLLYNKLTVGLPSAKHDDFISKNSCFLARSSFSIL